MIKNPTPEQLKRREARRKYMSNPEVKKRIYAQTKQWQKDNPEKFKAAQKRWANKPETKEAYEGYQTSYHRNYRKLKSKNAIYAGNIKDNKA